MATVSIQAGKAYAAVNQERMSVLEVKDGQVCVMRPLSGKIEWLPVATVKAWAAGEAKTLADKVREVETKRLVMDVHKAGPK